MTQYPAATTFWNDGSGVFGLHWTLTVSNAAIISTLWGILLTFAVTRLMVIAITTAYLGFLHQRNYSLVSDQGHVIASNNPSPGGLLLTLLRYAYKNLTSGRFLDVFLSYSFLAMLALGIQGVLVWKIGHVFSDAAVPVQLAPCAYAAGPNVNENDFAEVLKTGAEFLKATRDASQDSVTRYLQCQESEDSITCPAPGQRNFTWQVSESAQPQCWFGTMNCYPQSHTLSQNATISIRDLGVLRESSMNLTFTAECSHIDTTKLLTVYSTQGYTDYFLGPVNANVLNYSSSYPYTFRYYHQSLENRMTNAAGYTTGVFGYTPGDNANTWEPASFLLDHLQTKDSLSDISGPADLSLIYVEGPFLTLGENDDPLFQAKPIPFSASDVPVHIFFKSN